MSVPEEATSPENCERGHQHMLDAWRQHFQCSNEASVEDPGAKDMDNNAIILAFAGKPRAPSGMYVISPERQGIAAPVSWAQLRPADSGTFLLVRTVRISAMRRLLRFKSCPFYLDDAAIARRIIQDFPGLETPYISTPLRQFLLASSAAALICKGV